MTGGSKIDFYIIKRNPTVTTKVVPPPLNLKEAVGGAPRVSGCRASDWGIIAPFGKGNYLPKKNKSEALKSLALQRYLVS